MAASTQFAYRTLKDLKVVNAAPVYEPLPGLQRPEGNLRCCEYSPCGRYFAWASPEKVTVIDATIGHVIIILDAQHVYELGFSPLGTFIVTWQRPGKDEHGDGIKNLKVWRVIEDAPTEGEDAHRIFGKFVQKNQSGWNLQYTFDERYCARVVTNEIQIYESGDLTAVWNKIRVEGVSDFAVALGEKHTIAVFIPERKGQPAAIKIFNVPEFETPVSQKNFFKDDKVQMKWNKQGTSLIILAETEVDKSNKTYLGETTLYLMSADGGFNSRITLDKDGPIHDVTWSPNSKEFAVVYGYVPTKTTIFNSRAEVVHNFALAPRNYIRFSPHGRFLLLAGFGQMAGQMDIYDIEKDYLKICTIEVSSATICDWSPDDKYILTAITIPRLRVDNSVRIWHVGGGLVYNEQSEELCHVIWRPQSNTSLILGDPLHPIPIPHESALAYLSTRKTPSKPAGAYRPPGARGTTTPLAFRREDQGGAAYVSNGSLSQGLNVNGFGKPRRRDVPGAEAVPDEGTSKTAAADGDEALSKAAMKNKKKREAKKAKEAADKVAALTLSVDGGSSVIPPNPSRSPERRDRRNHERNGSRTGSELRPRSQNRPRGQSRARDGPVAPPSGGVVSDGAPIITAAAAAAALVPSTPDFTVTSPGGGTPQEKKIRALTKKLRAIDDLRMRRAGGETLEGTQIKKMETEESVRRELEGLGWTE